MIYKQNNLKLQRRRMLEQNVTAWLRLAEASKLQGFCRKFTTTLLLPTTAERLQCSEHEFLYTLCTQFSFDNPRSNRSNECPALAPALWFQCAGMATPYALKIHLEFYKAFGGSFGERHDSPQSSGLDESQESRIA